MFLRCGRVWRPGLRPCARRRRRGAAAIVSCRARGFIYRIVVPRYVTSPPRASLIFTLRSSSSPAVQGRDFWPTEARDGGFQVKLKNTSRGLTTRRGGAGHDVGWERAPSAPQELQHVGGAQVRRADTTIPRSTPHAPAPQSCVRLLFGIGKYKTTKGRHRAGAHSWQLFLSSNIPPP
jgi:hypothetical protein